ncbi:MAG: DNA-binding domain-containing protein [Burkholderiaceae bacterium]|nr:DNA-binding domain-containing protein [Burkholderiaceae bacterium]
MATLEAQQSALLHALLTPGNLWPDHPVPAGISSFIADNAYPESARGLNCYKSNAHASAERALMAAYPVVTAILSAESMAQLARALWHTHPPERGDLAQWGDTLPTFVAGSGQLANIPWLADVARVEWALHQADGAADTPPDLPTLALLAQEDAAHLTLRLAPGLQVLTHAWAVVPVLHAHRQLPGPDQTQTIAALGSDWCPAHTEHTLVWRVGHQPAQLVAIPEPEAAFLQALLSGHALLPALEACDLDFASWLPKAIQNGWVLGADVRP